MACEKKGVSNFAVKVGLVLLAGCILVPISLATLFRICSSSANIELIVFSRFGFFSNVEGGKDWLSSFRHKRKARALRLLQLEIRLVRAERRRLRPPQRHPGRHLLRWRLFHDLTDVLVPLFVTARRFTGDVHLLVTDTQPWWLDKFRPLLRGLSRHGVVDMDRAGGKGGVVLCYPRVVLGLEFHKEMSVDAARTAGGYSIADFGDPTASPATQPSVSAAGPGCCSSGGGRLGRSPTPAPRARAAAALGYEVVVGEPAGPAFARVVNSCDVLVSVHGAGLANLVGFLPAGAVVVHVVPLGGLDAVAAEDFGAPALDAGLR